jgi:2-desacetyl-2-hydroxyethyl bacteriochlorophyllide A dehydrogenase
MVLAGTVQGAVMDALVVAEPGKLEIVVRSEPQVRAGEALVRPRRVGICGTDYHILEGKHPFLQYPRVMGHELAVEVVEAPADSPVAPGGLCVVNPYLSCGRCVACRKGKPNCCVRISVLGVHQDGGMASLLTVPVGNLVPAPGLTADQCAAVEFLAIGAHAVRRGGVSAKDRVLVVGIGPIGLGVALFARLSGAGVAVFDRDPDRVDVAVSLVGAAALAPTSDASDAANAYTDGDGFDVVFDATGSPLAMEKGFDFVAHGGRYVFISVVKGSITFTDPDFHQKEMSLFGSRNATSEDFSHVIASIRRGEVPIDRFITHRTSLTGAVGDLPRWATQKSGLIKALIDLD